MAKSLGRGFWAVATVVFLTLLLRPPLAMIGPLLPDITKDMQLSASQVGLLTSIPVLCFGVGAFAGPRIQQRFGLVNAFNGILLLLAITIATRVWFGFDYLVVATVVMGLGIALSNVLFPALIRAEFPNSVVKMTATYTTMLSGFSALASAIAFPLANALGGWKMALTVVAVPALLGLIAWGVTVKLTHPQDESHTEVGERAKLWNHPLAWAIAGFFGLQSSNFYLLLNWLPSILIHEGVSPLEAGGVLGFMSVIGIPVGMLITANLKRIPNLTLLVLAISAVTAVGLGLYLLGPALVIPASVLTGFGLSSSFPLSLALIGMKGSTQAITTGLSALSQGMGYLFAAAIVFVAGLSFDLTQSWTPALVGAIALSLLQAGAGIYAVHHRGI